MNDFLRENADQREPRQLRPAAVALAALLGGLALLVFLLLTAPPPPSIEIAMIDGIEKRLLLEGFKLEEHTMMVDEISLGPANFLKRAILSKVYPGYQTRSANRRYSRQGAQLGIDYGIIDNKAVNISLPADPAAVPQAKQIFREIAASNPYVAISMRTNAPPASQSSGVVR